MLVPEVQPEGGGGTEEDRLQSSSDERHVNMLPLHKLRLVTLNLCVYIYVAMVIRNMLILKYIFRCVVLEGLSCYFRHFDGKIDELGI